MSMYLGRGAKSRGRMTITSALNTVVSTNPYLNNENDEEAIIIALQNLLDSLSGVEDLEWQEPAPDVSAREYIENVGSINSARTRA